MSFRRETYISAQDICNCLGGNQGVNQGVGMPFKPRTTFQLGTNFKLLYRFINSCDLLSTIPLSYFDFIFRYYILGDDTNKEYFVSKQGTTLVNCIADEEKSVIKAIFNDYELPAGDLWCDFKIIVPDADMPDGDSSCIVTQDTAITLID